MYADKNSKFRENSTTELQYACPFIHWIIEIFQNKLGKEIMKKI